MSADAIIHLDAAIAELTGEAYQVPFGDTKRAKRLDGVCTIVWDLDRIDGALGPRGQSMFYALARKIETAFVEIKAARNALTPTPPPPQK